MKDKYFNEADIQSAAEKMLDKVRAVQKRERPLSFPASTAMLVLDMQDYFLNKDSHAFIPSAPAIISRVQDLIDDFVQNQMPIVYTRHINTPQDAKMMGVWWRDLIEEDQPESRISDKFDTTVGTIISKTQYDAFYKSNLENLLVERKVTDVVISGVMTHLCCETTARSAFMRGFRVWFPVDGTATYNREFHTATLTNLSHGFATPVLVDEVLAALGRLG